MLKDGIVYSDDGALYNRLRKSVFVVYILYAPLQRLAIVGHLEILLSPKTAFPVDICWGIGHIAVTIFASARAAGISRSMAGSGGYQRMKLEAMDSDITNNIENETNGEIFTFKYKKKIADFLIS